MRSAEGFISAQGDFPALRYGGFAATRGCTPCAASRLSLHTHKNSTPAVGVCTVFAGFIILSESVHAEESSTADYIPVIPVISDDTTNEPAEKETEPEILTQYASMYEQNPDLFGWVCIEDTVLDYPVMHTPDDPEKYLRLSFEGETSTAGTPFMDAKCGIDSDLSQR